MPSNFDLDTSMVFLLNYYYFWIYLSVCVIVLSACMTVHHSAFMVPEEAREGIGSSRMQLLMVVSHMWVLRAKPRSLARVARPSSPCPGGHLPSPPPTFKF